MVYYGWWIVQRGGASPDKTVMPEIWTKLSIILCLRLAGRYQSNRAQEAFNSCAGRCWRFDWNWKARVKRLWMNLKAKTGEPKRGFFKLKEWGDTEDISFLIRKRGRSSQVTQRNRGNQRNRNYHRMLNMQKIALHQAMVKTSLGTDH